MMGQERAAPMVEKGHEVLLRYARLAAVEARHMDGAQSPSPIVVRL